MSPAAWSHKLKLTAEQYPEIEQIHDALELGRRRVGRDTLADVVRDVWMALDGPAKVAAPFGAEGVANCRLFLEVLESIDAGIPEETLLRLDLALETLHAPEAPDAAGTPVDLMTVHAAKGLEFDVVFLPFLDWRPLAVSQPPPYLLERSSEPQGLPLIAMGPDRRLGEPEPGYPVLKRLANGRRMGEAKRLFYVGITRARKELFLSGVAKHTQSGVNAPKDSPLAWVLTDTTDHDENSISTFFNPVGPTVVLEKGLQMQPLPTPTLFEAQPLPYLIETPSELVDASIYEQDAGKGEAEPAEHSAIRGTITHRLIEVLWQSGALPEIERIATAIAAEGLCSDTAMAVAQEIVDEVKACQEEPFFQWLLDRERPHGESEYAIEAIKRQGTIQTGILDFVRQDENHWWIADFKTSRPAAGQVEVEFVEQQVEYYRPQLVAYRAMLTKTKGVDVARIRMGLYFTGLQQWHEIK
jgi:ATP-dependent exoDNAse (exonuclease V) beta subunit